jgi:small subunit ribosomal protein S23
LIENEGLSKEEAYNTARKEFYDLRMREDIERRVASEEALAVGAKFGKSYLEIGIELEGQALEEWKAKALAFLQLKRGRQAAFSGAAAEEEEPAAAVAVDGILEGAEGEAAPTPGPAGGLL